jgi:diguanylate cyclase (GGDEF)-like protein
VKFLVRTVTRLAEHARPFRLNSRLMSKTAQPQQILLVDDDPGAIQLLGGLLANVAALRFATNGKDALRLAHELVPDLILLDAEMPGMTGFELLKTLKAEAEFADVPVIFITSHTEAGFEVSALEMGAVDFIAKPFRSSLVLARVRLHLRMKRMADGLRRAATLDSLTGVANRRMFDQSLAREWLLARRTGDPISLLSMDVDHFKSYNERYGRQQGDECLRQVAAALVSACRRPADLVARYDGQHFMLLLPQTARLGAEHIGRRVLDAVQALDIAHEESLPTGYVSVSVGIAFHDDQSKQSGDASRFTAEGLVAAANSALGSAKRAGRARAKMRDVSGIDGPERSEGSDTPAATP